MSSEEPPGLTLGQAHLGLPRGSGPGVPGLLLSLPVGPTSQTSSPEAAGQGQWALWHQSPGT